MPAGLGFIIEAIIAYWYYGITEFTAFRGTVCMVLIAACSVRSNCLLYLVVVSIYIYKIYNVFCKKWINE